MCCYAKIMLLIISITLSIVIQGCDSEPQITKDSTPEEILKYKRFVVENKLAPGMDRSELVYRLGTPDAIEVLGTQYDTNDKKSYKVLIIWYFDIAGVKVINNKIVEIMLVQP